MRHYKSIEQVLAEMDRSIVKKITIFPTKTTVLVLLSLGIIEIDRLLPDFWQKNLTPLLAVVVLVMLLWGFLSDVLHKDYYKNLITNQRVNFCSLYYDRSEYENLINIVESRSFYRLDGLYKSKSNSVKLEIACTDDKSICYLQVVKYMPFQYAVRSKAQKLTAHEMDEFLHAVHGLNFAL